MEGVILLPSKKDFSQIGVKNKDLHFLTAGSKGFKQKMTESSTESEISSPLHLCRHLLDFLAGVLRVWEASTARCVYTQTLNAVLKEEREEKEEEKEENEDNPRSLTHLLHLPASSRLATVTAEHNIVLYQLPGLTTQQQVGTLVIQK